MGQSQQPTNFPRDYGPALLLEGSRQTESCRCVVCVELQCHQRRSVAYTGSRVVKASKSVAGFGFCIVAHGADPISRIVGVSVGANMGELFGATSCRQSTVWMGTERVSEKEVGVFDAQGVDSRRSFRIAKQSSEQQKRER
jgi:hypothetical protein